MSYQRTIGFFIDSLTLQLAGMLTSVNQNFLKFTVYLCHKENFGYSYFIHPIVKTVSRFRIRINMSEKNNEPPMDNGGDEGKKEEPNDVDNGGDEEAGNVKKSETFNVDSYATHKTLTAGAMDIALLTSNANQTKMLASSELGLFQYVTLAMLVISIIMQFIVVHLIIMMATSRCKLASTDAEDENKKRKIDKMNKYALELVTFITFINVLAAAFTGDLKFPSPNTSA